MGLLRKKINNFTEAEENLSEVVKVHSKRVEDYAKILFCEGCQNEELKKDQKFQARFKDENIELISTISRFHDIGKVFIPDVYQTESKEFSEEEDALYKKHAHDGEILIATYYFIDNKSNAFDKNCILSGIASHHERWDGTGFPAGLKGNEIPILGRLMAIADTFDHEVCELHSENPFEEAYEKMLGMFGTAFDPKLKVLFENTKAKLKKVYRANIHETRTIPEVIRFVKNTKTRPMNLKYRFIVDRKTEKFKLFMADPRFKGKDGYVTFDEVEELAKKNKMIAKLGVYFVYEACDTVCRLNACEIPFDNITIKILKGWLKQAGIVSKVETALKEEKVDASKIVFCLPMYEFFEMSATQEKNIAGFAKMGIKFALKASFPIDKPAEILAPLNVKYLYIVDSEDFAIENEKTEAYMDELKANGITVISQGIQKDRDLNYFDVKYACGIRYGEYLLEDEIVERLLALEKAEELAQQENQ